MADNASLKSPVAPGDVVLGKYRVEHVLGSGGMGVVVAARHLELDQPVALKFILPHALAGKGSVERFMREARAAVRLKSEHVARVYDVGRDAEDRPFMVLELLEGMDLAKLNKHRGPLPVADSVEYVLQACEALVEAHASGIVHRDLKPQNLFVTRRLNGTPLVKVLDFGIAKAFGPGAVGQMALTDSAAIIGSPLYMAPEQMRSARAAEVRSDIWALGVILYELLGGQAPFDGETVTEVCIRVVNEEPKPLAELRPGLDPPLVAIVMRCLEKEPEARFHNVAALAAMLDPFSRSGKLGGLVRPWRSFEDTQDSADGKSPFAPGVAVADATGPSTAVTIRTLDDLREPDELSEDVKRARARAGSTKASPSSAPPSAVPSGASPPLVSTGVSWGESGSPGGPRARTVSIGVVAGLLASVAAAAVVLGLLVGRSGASPRSSAAAGGGEPAPVAPSGPVGSSPPVTAAEGPTAPASAAPAPSSSAAAPAIPSALASVSAVKPAAGKGARGGTRPAAPPRTASEPPPAVPGELGGHEAVSPNGAPILR
jgi:serine/threonine-protein kinase